MHSIQKGSYFLDFLEIHEKLAGKNAFEHCIIYWPFLRIFVPKKKKKKKRKDGSTIHEILGDAGYAGRPKAALLDPWWF